MGVRWSPCRVCGDATAGEDSYVICGDCALDFAERCLGTRKPADDLARAPITPEIEAQLRKLLDW
jgi:hypothetical protein